MKRVGLQLFMSALALCWAGLAWAADFDHALKAYDRGNYNEAADEFMALAEDGHAKSQFNLGLMYFRGLGVERDSYQARVWALKSARQGYVLAQYTIGAMYSSGQGFEKDAAEAAKWFQRAAEQGDPRAQHDLAGLHGEGRGVARDNVLSHMWYSLAIPNLKGEAKTYARENRTILELRMSVEEMLQAKRIADEWRRRK